MQGKKFTDEEYVQLPVRLPRSAVEEAERLGRELAPPGTTLSKTDILRSAITIGLEELRERADNPPPPRARKRPGPRRKVRRRHRPAEAA